MEGQFNWGFFVLRVWGAHIWKGLIHGGAYFRNFMVYYYFYYIIIIIIIIIIITPTHPIFRT